MDVGDTNKNKQLSQKKCVPKVPQFLWSAQNIRDKSLDRVEKISSKIMG